MSIPSFTLTVTACEKPFWRGGLSLLLLFLIPVALGVLLIPDLWLPIRITSSIFLCFFCIYYIRETIASLKIDMGNSLLVLTKTFYETTIRLSEIQAVSFFVMPSSFYCEILLKLKSGRKEKFVFVAVDTNLGSFSETIRILREKFGIIVDHNQSCREAD